MGNGTGRFLFLTLLLSTFLILFYWTTEFQILYCSLYMCKLDMEILDVPKARLRSFSSCPVNSIDYESCRSLEY